MTIQTFSELKLAIQAWSKRSDILDVVDTFIDMAESNMWTELRLRSMETTTTGSVSGRTLALPTGFIRARRMRLYSGANSYPLEYAPPESMKIDSTSGIPSQFTVTSQIEFDRVPASNYSYELVHYASLTSLSDANPTNAVLTRFPTIYLYGAIEALQYWALNPTAAGIAGQLFRDAIDKANEQDRRGRYGPAPAMRTEASTP